MRSPRRLLLSLACTALAWASCQPAPEGRGPNDSGPGAKAPVLRARVAPLVREPVPVTVPITGTLFGEQEVALAPDVSGRLVLVAADVGDVVLPGAELARIEPLDFELARDERRRALDQAVAQLGLSQWPQEGPGDVDVEALPSVVRARLEEENARSRYERAKGLAEARTTAISEQALGDLRTAADVARSDLELARIAAGAALAQVRTLEAQVRQAERRLELTSLRAPPEPAEAKRTWAVSDRRSSVGDFAVAGAVLFRLVDPDPLLLRGFLPERYFGVVRVGQTVEVSAGADPSPAAGVVLRIAPAVDQASRSFLVEIQVPNPAGRLAPGGFASAAIRVGEREAQMAPSESLASFAGVHRVFRAEGGVVRAVRVEPGLRLPGRVEVIGEFPVDALLVLDPPTRLVDGAPLEILPDSQPKQPAASPTDGSAGANSP